jgi:hypothetical protein
MYWSRLLLSAAGVLGLAKCSLAATVDSKILILARDAYSASTASSGLEGYGIPFQTVLVPKEGITLPSLSSSGTAGNYGGIIVLGAVSYDYDGSWRSALTDAQWTTIHTYQTNFKVRLTRIDEFPGPAFGKYIICLGCVVTPRPVDGWLTRSVTGARALNGGCCGSGVEQLVAFTNISAFPTANVKT